MSQSDSQKRLDLFLEFVYYAFDSLLIPLIRSHFFVTESNVHRYRIFFFRHDVWRSISEPQLASLKNTMLEEVNAEDAQKILDSRTLGFSQLRLLPKEAGVRPIMNLRRRPLKKGHKKMLGSSINSLLAPVYNMYTYEKVCHRPKLFQFLMLIEYKSGPLGCNHFLRGRSLQEAQTIPQRHCKLGKITLLCEGRCAIRIRLNPATCCPKTNEKSAERMRISYFQVCGNQTGRLPPIGGGWADEEQTYSEVDIVGHIAK